MLREDLGPSVEAHSRRWELVVNAYMNALPKWGMMLITESTVALYVGFAMLG